MSVCHICLAPPCLRESLYMSGLVSVSPSQKGSKGRMTEVWSLGFQVEAQSVRCKVSSQKGKVQIGSNERYVRFAQSSRRGKMSLIFELDRVRSEVQVDQGSGLQTKVWGCGWSKSWASTGTRFRMEFNKRDVGITQLSSLQERQDVSV